MNAILAIALNDLRQLLRDRMALFFATVFPILIASFFGLIFRGSGEGGDPNKIDVLVVDVDQTDGSRAFVSTLKAATELNVVDAPSREEAVESIRTGKAVAVIALPKGFGASRENMFWGSGSEIELGVDPSRRAEAGMLEGVLTKYGFMQMQDMFANPSKMRTQVRSSLDKMKSGNSDIVTKTLFSKFFGDLDQFLGAFPDQGAAAAPGAEASAPAASSGLGAWQPLRIKPLEIQRKSRNGPPNSFAITFPQGIIWGVMGCTLGFAVGMVQERTRGTMTRLRVAPLSRTQILGGKALACYIATFIVALGVMLVGVGAFGVRPTSWPMLIMAIACVAVCFVGIMMLLAVFGRSERGGNSLGWGVLLVLSMIGGGMIPLFFMPDWMKPLSMFSPIRYAILALEGGIWRGMSFQQIAVPCLVLLGIGAAGFAIGARFMSRTEAT